MEDEDKGRKSIALKVNEDDQICSSNNEDEIDDDEDMALVMRKFKRFCMKGFNKRGKKPPFEKGGQNYNDLKKKVSDLTLCIKSLQKKKKKKILKSFLVLKDHLLTKVELDIIIPILLINKHVL
ncbi:hypothetical protein M9H77_28251 [Catharanthus roseus]|uniref:Uncharacterized protein n=1 Tax=Catharanthus roseus TaxID=4058 RepID=A0ACC0AEV2_CATRO|nr:hypothetical protein M9H77_28251 [Catharanthus roseus]